MIPDGDRGGGCRRARPGAFRGVHPAAAARGRGIVGQRKTASHQPATGDCHGVERPRQVRSSPTSGEARHAPCPSDVTGRRHQAGNGFPRTRRAGADVRRLRALPPDSGVL